MSSAVGFKADSPARQPAKLNLLGLDRQAMEAFVVSLGEKPFRATQLIKWIHQRGVADFNAMTDLSKAFRAKLEEACEVRLPEAVFDQRSADGTRKWLLRLDGGNAIEVVFIPEPNRGTLCVSSQVGCALECSFCSTATQGFNRNLSMAEIIGQLRFAVEALAPEDVSVTNVVFMGMGEPLLNFNNVVAASNLMIDDHAYGLSKRRVTISTSGVVPALYRLAEATDVSLAVSLHAPDDALRDELVPINKKYPISELLPACHNYIADKPHRHVTWEYVMLDGVNDHDTHARQLGKLLQGIPGKINLIPFNPFPGSGYQRSSAGRIQRFAQILQEAGHVVTTRKTRGEDIDGACGQLVGKVQDRTKRRFRREQEQHIPPTEG